MATPTYSAIDLAENPLDRRALVSLKAQLEVDQPNNKLLQVSYNVSKSEIDLTNMTRVFHKLFSLRASLKVPG